MKTDIKILEVKYLLSSGYKTKTFKFKSPQNRYDIVKVIDSVKRYSKVFSVTGYNLEGSFI